MIKTIQNGEEAPQAPFVKLGYKKNGCTLFSDNPRADIVSMELNTNESVELLPQYIPTLNWCGQQCYIKVSEKINSSHLKLAFVPLESEEPIHVGFLISNSDFMARVISHLEDL